jgi:predicted amidohydrolase
MTESTPNQGRTADRVTVAVLQLAPDPGEVKANVKRLLELVEEHGPDNLDMLGDRALELAEPADGPTAERLRQAAARVGATLVVGFLERDRDRLFDSLLTVTPTGDVSVYRKNHLYPPELAVFAAGDTLGVVETPAGVLGPLVCFDHAFPEAATTLALAGAQILVIPSAVPFGYEHLLQLRTRARAQDNQIFAIGCNLAGHGFCGRSLVADPRGDVLASAEEEATVLVVELDLAAVSDERGREPSLRTRLRALHSDSAER